MGELYLAGGVVLGALALQRVGSLRHPGPARSLELALIFFALAEVLQLGPVRRLANGYLGTPAGAAMLKTALGDGVAAAVAGVAEGARARPRRLRGLWAGAIVAMAVGTLPLVVWPVRAVPPELVGTTEYFGAGWRSVVHWVPFLAFTCWAMGSALTVSWAGARKAGPGSLRASLYLVAAACTMGYLYVASKCAVLVAWHLRGADLWPWARFDQDSEVLTVSLGCLLGATSAGWENLGATRRALQRRLALWQLRPLWKATAELAPAVRLSYGRADPEFRLRRRVMEIMDAFMVIEGRLATEVVEAAQTCAGALGAPSPLTVAAVVRYLADQGGAGQGACPHGLCTGPARLPTASAGSFDEELEWLKEVSRWYRDPKAKALSARLATTGSA
jgi:hypothetical protein